MILCLKNKQNNIIINKINRIFTFYHFFITETIIFYTILLRYFLYSLSLVTAGITVVCHKTIILEENNVMFKNIILTYIYCVLFFTLLHSIQ
jgi:hypothetical protein